MIEFFVGQLSRRAGIQHWVAVSICLVSCWLLLIAGAWDAMGIPQGGINQFMNTSWYTQLLDPSQMVSKLGAQLIRGQ